MTPALPTMELPMHDRETRLVQILRTCDYDRSRLSDVDAAEAFALAARASIELWRAGVAWPSSPGADLIGGKVTRLDPRL